MPSFRQEVVDVLFNRDLNLLCRIEEMRKAQKIEIEERKLRRWREKVGSKSCFASKRNGGQSFMMRDSGLTRRQWN
jgi:hypothetical protein